MPNALVKNIITEANDLILNLDKPHSPCPLVHPFPNFVPNPTSKPAKANPKKDVFSSIFFIYPKGVKLLLV